jgi:Rne/Rng family ribonuclease
MNKELFVTTTPHETKVGITEDDQLAEIYLERENEYTLAGSIYKGRVTRVLPGMQSAFVDIGLERDAFLYVSDFMDLEHQDEDLDEAIPANRPAQGNGSRAGNGAEAGASNGGHNGENGSVIEGGEQTTSFSETSGNAGGGSRDYRGGRRRRRGRRGEHYGRSERADRNEARTDSTDPAESEVNHSDDQVQMLGNESRSGNRSESGNEGRSGRGDYRSDRYGRGDRRGRGESRFQRTTSHVGRDYDYGPPPGYQPIVLPGESISKYQRQSPGAIEPAVSEATGRSSPEADLPNVSAAITANFPEDEPIFATNAAEPLHEQHDHVIETEVFEEETSAASHTHSDVTEFRSKSSALTFTEHEEEVHEETSHENAQDTNEDDFQLESIERHVGSTPHARHGDVPGTLEEQEIEEEEAELRAYGEEPGDDDDLEELEEETRAASGETIVGETATGESGEAHSEPVGVEDTVNGNGEVLSEAALEAEEREAEELELEEAQAEAEALLEAEAIGEGIMDASAEVRSPAPEARLLQRTQRRSERGYDRGRGRRGGRRFRGRENTVAPQISELLKEGQEVLIQIAKEPIAKKGARITSHIALPGRFLVFMPTVNHTGVSRKIASEEERQRLKRIIQSERENGAGGFIVRTAAAGASDEELRADIRFLKNLWNEIKTRSENSKAPALIYHDLNVVERVLRDQVSSDFSAVWVDTEQEYERILRFANRFQPGLVKRVKLYTKETPLYDQFGLNEEINKALKSKVWLKSGGYIVINQTEALVAIDVNTGKYVGKTARLEDTIVKTNVDAIKEIVRQIRLRDLGGIIIIDFIDMDERRNRQKVMQALEEALRLDRAPSKVLQFNDFGLVAITRKRVKQSLERTIGSPCPYCQSTGFVKSVGTVCNEVYVEMRKISSHLEHSDVMLRVNPEVAKALKANNAKLLTEMEELTKKTVIVKSDPSLHQEQFDIH